MLPSCFLPSPGRSLSKIGGSQERDALPCLFHSGLIAVFQALAMHPPCCLLLCNSPPSLGLSFSKPGSDTA